MQLRWKRIWFGMDVTACVWIAVVFWLAFHGHGDWWWRGFGLVILYGLVRYAVLAIDHLRTWRLWALFDLMVWAIVIVMAFSAEAGNPWAFLSVSLLLAHFAFVKWRARRWPRRQGAEQ
jgi:hypothetical protein